ncbi:tRNA 2-thiouridine(34) synthase MnmA [Thermostilla marina]
MARVVLAMSGGVDSSTAAGLLLEAGHEVVGLFMRHGIESPCRIPDEGTLPIAKKQGCCSAADAADARAVAQRLGIPFYALNFEEEFGSIVDYFVDTYLAGRTPNPCIVCNNDLKFGKLFEYADSIDAEYVATGHYARIVSEHGEPALCRGRDAAKDQSYVLFGIRRDRLSRIMLPVGEYTKSEIRARAERLGLRVADKPDSQEICFVPDQDHARVIREARPDADTAGEIVTTTGEVVGTHDGYERFTIGQRKGLGIAFGEPRYVVRIEPHSRRVVVGTREELACRGLIATHANWLIDPPAEPIACEVKIRYRSRAVPATVEPLGNGRFRVQFAEPCHGVAPGQAAVCYRGERVLGGGWIDTTEPA